MYARNGATIRAQYEGVFGNYTETHISASVANSDRKNAYLVKESYVTNVQTQTQGWPTTTTPGLQVKYTSVPTTNYKYKISEVPHGTTISTGGNIVEVTPVNGYLPTHYRYVSGLTEGLKRSFFKGSTQRSGSTPDGLDPVEIFTTNPNILKVANTGRGSGEPILIVD